MWLGLWSRLREHVGDDGFEFQRILPGVERLPANDYDRKGPQAESEDKVQAHE
jgi:hypothetical protein